MKITLKEAFPREGNQVTLEARRESRKTLICITLNENESTKEYSIDLDANELRTAIEALAQVVT